MGGRGSGRMGQEQKEMGEVGKGSCPTFLNVPTPVT